MKKFLLLLVSVVILASCSNGLNKSIAEPLTVDELKSHMKDTTFMEFYSYAQGLGLWINESEVRQAQYGDITYKRLKNYMDYLQDTALFNSLRDSWLRDYESKYPDYSDQVDSIMTYWRNYQERYNMDSVVLVVFDQLWKEYYSYIGGVKSVNVGFRITPLKGTIDQLVFRYEMITKVNNDGSNTIDWLNGHRCVATSPIITPKTLYWEADYHDEKRLEFCSTEEVRRDYDFIIEIVNVRVNGENFEDKLNAIPVTIQRALKYSTPEANWYKDDIIKEFLNPEHLSFYEYTRPLYQATLEDHDPLVYSLIKSYKDE